MLFANICVYIFQFSFLVNYDTPLIRTDNRVRTKKIKIDYKKIYWYSIL